MLEEIFSIITSHCHSVLGSLNDHVISKEDRLKELGANSIDRAEIISLTMDSLSIDVPRVDLFGAETIGDLAQVFYTKINKN